MPKARVFILYTGGTIGMRHSDPEHSSSPLVPRSWQELQDYMPSIQSNGYFTQGKDIDFEYHSFEKVMDSSQFNTQHWVKMADEIEKRYDEFDGFIIIHGTDTMAHTASGLSFIFENLGKPVVLTGSQLPISHSRTDAVINLSNAIHIAAAHVFGLDPVCEVCICFNDKVIRGNRGTKASTNDFDGFVSPNYPALVELEEGIKVKHRYVNPPNNFKFQTHKDLNTNVMEIGLFPGLKASQLEKLVIDEEVEGLIIKTYGAGNAPFSDDFVSVLREARKKGTFIMFITQCQQGGVKIGKYEASSIFKDLGIISGGDMTAEAAHAKMMSVLGMNLGQKETVDLLEKDMRGERSY
jgi:L-asparaginase